MSSKTLAALAATLALLASCSGKTVADTPTPDVPDAATVIPPDAGDVPAVCTKTQCGSECSDLKTDPKNCGTCGSACAAGKACVDGICQCGTQGSTTECPSGQVCDVSPTGNSNVCTRICAFGPRTCPTTAVCAPVSDDKGAYSGVNDCFADTHGKGVGEACGGNDCRADLTCVQSGSGRVCASLCIVGGAVTCLAGETCTDLGRGKNLGYCKGMEVCTPNAPCALASNPCHKGTTTCANGVPSCVDTNGAVDDGTACGMDKVCQAGSCTGCVEGESCTVTSNACHVGKRSCKVGSAFQCQDTGMVAAPGTACGTDAICSNGSCQSCVKNAACTPANPCHSGTTLCDAQHGAACVDSGNAANEGQSCGTNSFCLSGSCQACTPGAACTLAGNPCHKGTLTCTASGAQCTDGGAVADGTSCGNGLACQGGACVACVEGAACTPTANPCHVGRRSCMGATAFACVDTGGSLADGATCGTDEICVSGVCQGCVKGAACTPANPCHTGKRLCDAANGTACVDSGTNLSDNTSCGASSFCASGLCVACSAGASCTVAGQPCHKGAIACTANGPVCNDAGNAQDGTSCGTNMFCQAGACTTCTAGGSCIPTNTCHKGTLTCGATGPTCTDTGAAVTNGTSCGTDQVCSGGVCAACASNKPCTPPSNPCLQGLTDCSSGAQACNATTTAVQNGTACGTDKVCSSGSCVACVANQACTPSNPCHQGKTDCSTGTQTCTDTGNSVADDTVCGTNLTCQAGQCLSPQLKIVVVAGDNQSATIDAPLSPVTLQIQNGAGAGVPGKTITLAPPDGAAAIPTSLVTDAAGKATFGIRLGRTVGPWKFPASAPGVVGATISATATVPADGTIFALVNAPHSAGDSGVPGPGTLASVGSIRQFVRASDGTIYFTDTDRHRVRKLEPSGKLVNVAGKGTCNQAGDNGLAVNAETCNPWGIALDEPNGVLYFSEAVGSSQGRIRAVDLTTGIITTLAGGNPGAPQPGFGDGSTGTAASLDQPHSLALGPKNQLIVADTSRSRFRVVNTQTGIINDWLSKRALPNDCNQSPTLEFWNLSGGEAAQVLFDPNGDAWISAVFAGSAVNAPTNNCTFNNGSGPAAVAVVRRSANGTLTAFAGSANGTTTEGTPASKFTFSSIPSFTRDPAGNLYFVDQPRHRILWMEASSGRMNTFSGASAGYGGDYVPGTDATVQYSSPTWIAIDSQRTLYVSDTNNYALREIYAAGAATKLTTTLSLVSGNNNSTLVDQPAPAQFRVKLADSAGNPLVNYNVAWTVVDSGGGLYQTLTTTDAAGTTRALGHAGLALGAYKFTASVNDPYGNPVSGSPVTFTLTATAANTGDLFNIVNTDHSSGDDGVPGNGAMAHVGTLHGFKQTSDGTIWIANTDRQRVQKLLPSGELRNVAGTGRCSYSLDNGLALATDICNPWDVAVDETNGVLYFSERVGSSLGRIRAVDLATGIITTLAGGNPSAPQPGFGDGSPGTSASLDQPTHLTLNGSNLYVADLSRSRIRVVNTGTGIINNWLSKGSVVNDCNQSVVLGFWNLSGEAGQVVFDSAGQAWVSAVWSGSAVNAFTNNCTYNNGSGPAAYAVVNVTTGAVKVGSVQSWQCGSSTCTASSSAGTATNTYYFDTAPYIALDATKTLYLSESTRHRIMKVDAANKVQLVSGTGTPGFLGDYAPLSGAQFNSPTYIQFLKTGRLTIADTNNSCLRQVYQP